MHRARRHSPGRHRTVSTRRRFLPPLLASVCILVVSVLPSLGAHASPLPAARPAAVLMAVSHDELAVAKYEGAHHLASSVVITVGSGQTLSGISAAWYGTARYWPFLAQVNHLADPGRIYRGERLLIPWPPRYVKPPPTHVGLRPSGSNPHPAAVGGFPATGVYTFSMLEGVWEWAGGPSWAAYRAALIATCESGGRTWAKNPWSDASGLWQINGAPAHWTGSYDWFSGPVNALAAVAKFRQAGDSFSPWVCAG